MLTIVGPSASISKDRLPDLSFAINMETVVFVFSVCRELIKQARLGSSCSRILGKYSGEIYDQPDHEPYPMKLTVLGHCLSVCWGSGWTHHGGEFRFRGHMVETRFTIAYQFMNNAGRGSAFFDVGHDSSLAGTFGAFGAVTRHSTLGKIRLQRQASQADCESMFASDAR